MVKTKANSLTSLINKMKDKARRLTRIDGAAPEIHQALLTSHRAKIAADAVGENENLGPSITNPAHPNHVFSVDSNNKITFGTSVVYAGAYNKKTGRDLVFVNQDTKTEIKKAIVKYVGLK